MSSNAIAIITARGGSKRIPRKNIKSFCGKPILAYSIEAALNSNLFEEVMVSTDDSEIAAIAKEYGALVPFLRSKETSDDYSNTNEVIAEVLSRYKIEGKNFEYVVCIYPTAPFITSSLLHKALKLLIDTPAANSVLPVTKFSFPPQRGMTISNDSTLKYWMPENANARSQDLLPIYHDAGQFYCCKTVAFFSTKRLASEPTIPLVLPETSVQDIDTISDWAIAELKYQSLNRGTDD